MVDHARRDCTPFRNQRRPMDAAVHDPWGVRGLGGRQRPSASQQATRPAVLGLSRGLGGIDGRTLQRDAVAVAATHRHGPSCELQRDHELGRIRDAGRSLTERLEMAGLDSAARGVRAIVQVACRDLARIEAPAMGRIP